MKLKKPSILVVNWISSGLFFFLNSSITIVYIFIVPTYTTTKITLEPCVMNVKIQHFILRFNKISLLCRYQWKVDATYSGSISVEKTFPISPYKIFWNDSNGHGS